MTLMLALASLLERLREDPGTVGKRYQLAVSLDPGRARRRARALPGRGRRRAALQRRRGGLVPARRAGAARRLPRRPHATSRTPPLAEGRRIRGPDEVEVGRRDGGRARAAAGLACSRRRSRTAARCASASPASCARWRTTGGSPGCEPDRLLAARPGPQPAGRRAPRSPAPTRADGHAAAASALGARLQPVGAAQTDNAAFLAVLAAVLRGVGLAVGLVCLYALVQALTVTARERRGAVALLRACGADGADRRPRARRRGGRRGDPGGARRRACSRSSPSARSSRTSPRASPSLPLAPDARPDRAGRPAACSRWRSIATALVARRVLREPSSRG